MSVVRDISMSFSENIRLYCPLIAVMALLALPVQVCAAPPPIAASSCDPDYYATLESRAWLEAQREITQNQNLISKPDSVLRYSCFDQMLSDYESATGSMFSGTVSTNQPYATANNFVNASFESAHLKSIGGRSAVASSLDYNCNAMAKIWEESQCMNFVDEKDYDAFFSLANYADTANPDRRFEGNCGKPGGWASESAALEPANTAWTEDTVKTFLAEFDTGGGTCEASLKVSTGVQAEINGTYKDVKVCVRNGCLYNFETDKCE